MDIFENDGTKLLMQAIISINDEDTCKAFLEDLMSVKEIVEISQRMQVADLLRKNKSYQVISEETGASTATISRVNRCYVYGSGGYKTILNKLDK